MKNYIQYIPLTVFAAAIVLGGSLSAAETAAPEGTGMREHQSQSQQPARTGDTNARGHLSEQSNSNPMMVSDVLGMNIDTADNEKIGEIDEIYIDSNTGDVLAIVVSTGGFLGLGQQQSLISPGDLRINAERTLMQTDISKDQIRNAPRYQEGETTGFDQVRPLGATGSDWEERKEQRSQRTDRSESGQHTFDGQRAGEQRAERSESEQYTSDGQRDGEQRTDRSESEQYTSDGQRAGEQRADRSEGEQAEAQRLAVSELIDMSVENRQGESVGNVDEVFLNLEDWEVVGVVVSTGGFLGIGDRKTLFGLQEMSFEPENEIAILDYNRDQIREFPEFKEDDQSVFEDLLERMDRSGPRSGSAEIQQ